MNDKCRTTREELQHDWVTPEEAATREEIKRMAMKDHVDFIMSTDVGYCLEALTENDEATRIFGEMCAVDLDNAKGGKMAKLAIELCKEIENYIKDAEEQKNGE